MKTREFIRQVSPLTWLIVISILCGGLFNNLFGSLTPEISSDLTLSPKQIGWLIFWGSASSAIGAFLGGSIIYRFHPQKLIFTYLLGMASAVIFLALSSRFEMLMISFMFYRLMVTGFFTLARTLIGQMQLVSAFRARVLALLDVGWSIGASIVPLWVIILLHIYPSWRIPFATFFFLVVALIFAYARPTIRAAIEQLSGFIHVKPHASITEINQTSHSYWHLMFAPQTIWVWITAILIGYVESGHIFWFVNYAHSGREIAVDQARLGLVGFTLGMTLIRTWQAFIHSELTTEQRLIRLSLIGCVAFVLIGLLPAHSKLWYMVTINFFAGVGIGVVFPILLNHLIDLSPHNTAKYSALLSFSVIFGAQLAGVIIGYTSEFLGLTAGYMTIAIAMTGFSFSVMHMFRLRRNPKVSPN